MENVWIKNANNFASREISQQLKHLPVGIFKFQVNNIDQPFLSQIGEKFKFDYKVYNLETKFVDRVVKTYEHTTGNLGVVLNGVKGTGKTVTAEQICNKLNMPVIIVSFHHPVLIDFLNEIQQDVIVFIDEFEKIYDSYKNSLLCIMDGVLKKDNRLFFMLTTNDLNVDTNLLQRPGRIRYIKTYKDLPLETIEEIIDDLLVYKNWREDCIKMISGLDIITVDIVKAIVNEVNIHDESPLDFKNVFNVRTKKASNITIQLEKDGVFVDLTNEGRCNMSLDRIYDYEGTSIEIDYSYAGVVKKVLDENTIILQMNRLDSNHFFQTYLAPFSKNKRKSAALIAEKVFEGNHSENLFDLSIEKSLPKSIEIKLRFIQKEISHRNFYNYAF